MNYYELDGYLVARGRRLDDLSAGEVVALAYYLILESLKAAGGEDYAEHRNALEDALREKKPLAVDGSDGRAPLPERLRGMTPPPGWSDD